MLILVHTFSHFSDLHEPDSALQEARFSQCLSKFSVWLILDTKFNGILCSFAKLLVLLVVTFRVVFLILADARGAASRQFKPFLLSMYSTNSDFVFLTLTEFDFRRNTEDEVRT